MPEDELYSSIENDMSSLQKVCSDETEIAKILPDPSKIKEAKDLLDEPTSFANEVYLNTRKIFSRTIKRSHFTTKSSNEVRKQQL